MGICKNVTILSFFPSNKLFSFFIVKGIPAKKVISCFSTYQVGIEEIGAFKICKLIKQYLWNTHN